MKIRLHVVVDSEDEAIESEVKEQLSLICPKLSFSPSREQPTLFNCVEWYATADIDESNLEDILNSLNNDWEGEAQDCQAYGFNTTMFHSNVYYLQFQIQ